VRANAEYHATADPKMILLTCVLAITAAAIAAPAMQRVLGASAGRVLALVPLAVFATLLAAGDVREPLAWMPAFDAPADMRIDGLSRLMALLVTGIGTLVVLYASGYMAGHPALGRFYCLLLMFMASMLGVVMADGLILLFVFWELTSVTSYLLIGFNHENQVARKKALQALIVTGGGGLALLAGLVMIGLATGEWTLTGVIATGDLLRGHAWYPGILALVLFGAFTKSAQFPFHFWLPNAMAGPTPVSAYLHSATMVKAGVFLLAILSPVLAGTPAWTAALTTAGAITLLLAAIRGLFLTDLKSVLAFTTLGVLGMLVLLLGVGTPLAARAAVLLLAGHAMYKAALFMVVGNLDHETGTREASMLGGLRRALPLTAGGALLAALSGGGLPPFFGFLGKEYAFKAAEGLGGAWMVAMLTVAVAGSALLLALTFTAGLHPFFGKAAKAPPKSPHEAPVWMWLGPVVLGVAGLAAGLFAEPLAGALVAASITTIIDAPADAGLSLWHGFNLPLLMSGVTLAVGLLIYRNRGRFHARAGHGGLAWLPSADAAYDAWLAGVLRFAAWQTRVLQSGHLRNYLIIIFASISALLVWKLGGLPAREIAAAIGPVPVYLAALFGVMMIATVMVMRTQTKATALIGFGIVGFGISLIFTYFGAPDLAITQIVVETLTIVLLFLILGRIPKMERISSRRTVALDAVLASVVGGLTVILVLKADLLNAAPSISGQMREWSYPLAKGRNVVNVILVDFRAMDTYAEVLVLVIAALGVGILMKPGRRTQP
jgi:multicomponent Na+:H+ antiporter subunit A